MHDYSKTLMPPLSYIHSFQTRLLNSPASSSQFSLCTPPTSCPGITLRMLYWNTCVNMYTYNGLVWLPSPSSPYTSPTHSPPVHLISLAVLFFSFSHLFFSKSNNLQNLEMLVSMSEVQYTHWKPAQWLDDINRAALIGGLTLSGVLYVTRAKWKSDFTHIWQTYSTFHFISLIGEDCTQNINQ